MTERKRLWLGVGLAVTATLATAESISVTPISSGLSSAPSVALGSSAPSAALGSSAPSAALGSSAPSAARLRPCHIDGLAEEVRCGVVEVFEDREARRGRTLPIHVAVLPALRRRVEPDPLVLLAGGPGQGARSYAPAAARYFREVRRHRDIVLVDLRGTGASHPLTCAVPADELAFPAEAEVAAQAGQCAAALDADPRHYTHRSALADLNDVRVALGYERINLWGGSWGTRAALLFALTYPEVTRSVVLDGAVPLTLEFPRTASTTAQAAFDRLVDLCRETPACRDRFPDPRAEVARLRARLSGGPVAVTLRHPRTHAETTLTLSWGMVAEILRGALYVPRDAAGLFQVIRQAAGGDFGALAAQHLRTASSMTDSMTLGATFAVLCSEDLPGVAGADFARDAAGSMFEDTYARIWRARCEAWPTGPGIEAPVTATSAVPALVLSGSHDPVTPPATGERMATHFTRQRHVVVPGAAHNTSFSACVSGLIADFIEAGHGDGLDAACAERVAWPPFVIDTAGSRP